MKKIVLLLSIFIAVIANAQIKTSGNVELAAGIGTATPWEGKVQLNITNSKLLFSPYFGIKGINATSSAVKDDIDFTYMSSGNHYKSSQLTEHKGTEYIYGAALKYNFNKRNNISFTFKGINENSELNGWRKETLHHIKTGAIESVESKLESPSDKRNSQDAELSYTHTNIKGGNFLVKYAYNRIATEESTEQTVVSRNNFNKYDANNIFADITTQKHTFLFDYKHPLDTKQILNLGARYEDREIKSNDEQLILGENPSDEKEYFHHRYRTIAAYAGYKLSLGAFSANALVEYDYTKMQENNLRDFLPQLQLRWQINKTQSLSASYTRRVMRPDIDRLNPMHIIGAYTVDYGNEDLIGIHVNNVSLIYEKKSKALDFSTMFTHIFVQDGYNAIWMEKDDIRTSFWRNEGVRRVWSITPSATWRASNTTTLSGKVNIAWDKRIAYAINLAKEHWGVNAEMKINQKLPLDIDMSVYGNYSEGNTLDLYSHTSRSWIAGTDIHRDFLNKKLGVTLSYSFQEYPETIITQFMYTGNRFTRPEQRNNATIKLSYVF